MDPEFGDWQRGYPVDLRGDALRERDAAGPFGDFERAAARIIARATGELVVLQDDNRRPRTPDLRIDYADGRRGVGEVVTVTDPQRAAFSAAWANGGLDMHIDRLLWQWWVTVAADANRKRLTLSLADVLSEMETADEGYPSLRRIDPAIARPGAKKLYQLGVTEVASNSSPAERRGHVIWQMEGIGGEVRLDWAAFDSFLEGLLAEALVGKKRDKLATVDDVTERHLFVGLSWSVPWAVLRILDNDVSELPNKKPALPDGITHLWIWTTELPGRALAWWPDRGWFDVAQRWATE